MAIYFIDSELIITVVMSRGSKHPHSKLTLRSLKTDGVKQNQILVKRKKTKTSWANLSQLFFIFSGQKVVSNCQPVHFSFPKYYFWRAVFGLYHLEKYFLMNMNHLFNQIVEMTKPNKQTSVIVLFVSKECEYELFKNALDDLRDLPKLHLKRFTSEHVKDGSLNHVQKPWRF